MALNIRLSTLINPQMWIFIKGSLYLVSFNNLRNFLTISGSMCFSMLLAALSGLSNLMEIRGGLGLGSPNFPKWIFGIFFPE